jgi:hypothetical protein
MGKVGGDSIGWCDRITAVLIVLELSIDIYLTAKATGTGGTRGTLVIRRMHLDCGGHNIGPVQKETCS